MSCLIAGCLVRSVHDGRIIFAHSWVGRLAIIVLIVGAAVVAAFGWNRRGWLATRMGIVAAMAAVMLSLVLPGWLLDRIEIDDNGLRMRVMSVVRLTRHEARWESLAEIRTARSQDQTALMLYEKGRPTAPQSIELDPDLLRAIRPDIIQFAGARGVEVSSLRLPY